MKASPVLVRDALVIDESWITKILRGEKTSELHLRQHGVGENHFES
jgi:hypothetical protein